MKAQYIAVIGAVIGIGALLILAQSFYKQLLTSKIEDEKQYVRIDDAVVSVDIANDYRKRQKGLSGTKTLQDGYGMLFDFTNDYPNGIMASFWMKDMLIDLDMIWIYGDEVVNITKNIPAPSPNTPEHELKSYSSGQPVHYVLEVPAGWSDRSGTKVGDTVVIN